MKMIKIPILVLLVFSCIHQGSSGPEHGSVLSADQTEIKYTVYGNGETALVFVQPFRQDFYNTTLGFVHNMFPPEADSVLSMEIAEDMAQCPADAAISAMINNISTDPVELLDGLDVPH